MVSDYRIEVISARAEKSSSITYREDVGYLLRHIAKMEATLSDRKPTSIRLSAEADRLLDVLAKKLGLKRSAVMEMAIRKLAEQEHVDEAR